MVNSFNSYLIEQEGLEPYNFVVLWYNDPNDPDNSEINADEIMSVGKKLGLKGFKVEVDGAYSEKIDGKRFIFDKDDNKFLCDENTLVFVIYDTIDIISFLFLKRHLYEIMFLVSLESHLALSKRLLASAPASS